MLPIPLPLRGMYSNSPCLAGSDSDCYCCYRCYCACCSVSIVFPANTRIDAIHLDCCYCCCYLAGSYSESLTPATIATTVTAAEVSITAAIRGVISAAYTIVSA